MKGIGGNVNGTIQTATTTTNAIGEKVQTWRDVQTLWGWLDLASGDSKYTTFAAKVQESTHLFITDYVPLDDSIRAENARMIVSGKAYDVTVIDNPMGMGAGSHLEISLRYSGGVSGG